MANRVSTGRRLVIAAMLVALAILVYRLQVSEEERLPDTGSSERQMPDFNPPIPSDRPDLLAEPRIRQDDEPKPP